MAGLEDILIRIRGQDQTGSAFGSIESKASHMGSAVTSAIGMLGGMIGYDIVNGLVEAGRGAINASGQLDYFAGRLGMTGEQSANFRKQLEGMQKEFRKVNMTSVGATAEDLASRYQLPIDKLDGLTKMTAVMSSEFIRNGRSQEDAVLAVADAMDGQFKRLQEIGITQDVLKKNGWNGNLEDQASLIDALNQTMSNMGYDKIAKDITNLDDAWQALTVTGGNLIASILVPLTPLIISVAEGLMGAVEFIKDNGWAQGAIIIGGLAVGFGLLAGAISVAAAAEGGMMALMPGFITSLYGAASGFMAITIAGAPLWAIVAAVAAIAIAVYEVGMYFGWWSDVSSMIAAISDGVRRLWEAFINSPQVQGAIQGIQWAFQQLWTFLQPLFDWLGQAWKNIFGDSGSNPDVVGGIINAFATLGSIASQVFSIIQAGWNVMMSVISPVVNMIQTVVTIISQLINGQISLEQAVVGIFTAIGSMYQQIGSVLLSLASQVVSFFIQQLMKLPGMIGQVLQQLGSSFTGILGGIAGSVGGTAKNIGSSIYNGIVGRIRNVGGGVSSALSGLGGRVASAGSSVVSRARLIGNGVRNAIVNGIRNAPSRVTQILRQIAVRLLAIRGAIVARARSIATGIRTGILNRISSIPGRIGGIIGRIPGLIAGAAGAVAGAAAGLASQAVNAVISGFSGLAGKVYQEFVNIGNKIRESVSSAVSAATSFGNDIKAAVLGALGIASPGIIQKKIAIEFADIPGRIKESITAVSRSAREYANGILNGFGNPSVTGNLNLNPNVTGSIPQPFSMGGLVNPLLNNFLGGSLNAGSLSGLGSSSTYTPMANRGGNVTIIVSEGAVQLDARNLTTAESKQVMINALEGMDMIRNVNIRGDYGY